MSDLQAILATMPTEKLQMLHGKIVEASLVFDYAPSGAEGKRRVKAIFDPLRKAAKGNEKVIYAAFCTAKPERLDKMIKVFVSLIK